MDNFELVVSLLLALHTILFFAWASIGRNLLGPFSISHLSFALIYLFILYPVIETRYGLRNSAYYEAFTVFSSIGGILSLCGFGLLIRESRFRQRREVYELSSGTDRLFLLLTFITFVVTAVGLLDSIRRLGGLPILVRSAPSDFDIGEEFSLSPLFFLAVGLNRASSAVYAGILAFTNRPIFAPQNRIGFTLLFLSSLLTLGGGYRSHLLVNFIIILFGAARRHRGAKTLQLALGIGGLLMVVVLGNMRLGNQSRITDNLNISTGVELVDDAIAWIANYKQPNLPNFGTRISMITALDHGYNTLIGIVPGAALRALPISYNDFIDRKKEFEKAFNERLDARGMNFTTSMAPYYADFGAIGAILVQGSMILLLAYSYFRSFDSFLAFVVFCSNIPGLIFICDVDFILGQMSMISLFFVVLAGSRIRINRVPNDAG